ncbi:hypothetical protein PTSG_05979 [Salpingoeca rosetta]|uniref:Uncharacterized protein n=1 Tax=Salpingoeca rosetta (strain ATCC 50818 / BSB-021) TaxID=946362 RepID=F2UDC0_SALR5|nr:uncharacterized protein PTSG_05979 [Salpingoeca rosetta]EGD74615.1 hypothetical protein PTSG_05979 [Salpingoeca rosetta]|eukprot:XP_004992872.1 hypothetical protein PTSG_05979 [Salpingoeca rosetta]
MSSSPEVLALPGGQPPPIYVPQHPFHVACALPKARRKPVRVHLQKYPDDINVPEDAPTKYTPLHFACMSGDLKLVKFLIKRGAHIRAGDYLDRTPADIAIMYHHKRIALYLLTLEREGLTAE